MEGKNLPFYFEYMSMNWEMWNVSDSNPSSSDVKALTSKLQAHLIKDLLQDFQQS